MQREEIVEKIHRGYAARMANDTAALGELWAEHAAFEIVGEKTLMEAFPAAGPMAVRPAMDALVALVEMSDARPDVVAVDGNRAVVLNHCKVSFAGRPPIATTICDIWQFDETGKVSAMTEFVDTAKLAQEMAALR